MMPWSVLSTYAAASFHRCLPAVLFATASLLMPSGPPAEAFTPADAQMSKADGQVASAADARPKTPGQMRDQAWTVLTDAVANKSADDRIQGLAALGTLGGDARSLKMIGAAMEDKDIDVRIAATLAAAQTKSPVIAVNLRRLLDDKEPPVAFAAALALWKMNDRSGEDILMAVADGERTAASGAFNSASHSVSRNLHHPGTLAKFGAMQGAGMLLGPFGIGISAFEYLHKNGGDLARVSAIEALGQTCTKPIEIELVAALADKDPGVRAAACKALSRYHDASIAAAIGKVFDDAKAPVRYTAAAAYLLSSGAVASLASASARKRKQREASAAMGGCAYNRRVPSGQS
jgi:HEAT repeat protein